MKKIISLLFILSIICIKTYSQPSGWFQQTLPNSDLINDIFFLDSSKGWVVTNSNSSGDAAYIFYTSNGGNNWNTVFTFYKKFYRIQFVDSNTGYLCGGYGIGWFYKSTTGGSNWTDLNLYGTRFLDMQFVNRDTGWVCDDDDMFGYGLRRTTNGGISWQTQLQASYGPSQIHFINKDTGWVALQLNSIYRTLNNGQNWSFLYSFSQEIKDIFFFNKDTGWAAAPRMYRTTNGGMNWIISSSQINFTKIHFVSAMVGWACSGSQTIYKTTDGGISWFGQSLPISNASVVYAYDSLKAWSGGNGIAHTKDGGNSPSNIGLKGNLTKIFSLSQNYPNPFNPVTKIKYDIPPSKGVRGMPVKLTVFDVLGREIETLVNQTQKPGSYEVTWDGSRYASEVYFYRLFIDDASAPLSITKKMVLIK